MGQAHVKKGRGFQYGFRPMLNWVTFTVNGLRPVKKWVGPNLGRPKPKSNFGRKILMGFHTS